VIETIINIFLIIDKDNVTGFKAKAYEQDGSDEEKIKFLKTRAKEDFESAYKYDAPRNKRGEFMSYKKFSKIEAQGMQYRLFEEIFEKFKVPEKPLICVTPVVNGEVWAK
jgi:hypothetical protein